MDDKTVEVHRWFSKAQNDLLTSETMLRVEIPPTDTICFHAQQCAEKVLKAFLLFHDQVIERTHYLPRLIELCSFIDASFQEIRSQAVALTDYAVVARYPDDWREIPNEEAVEAVDYAKQIMIFVRGKIQ